MNTQNTNKTTKLPSVRSEEMIQILEEQTNFYITIGDGENIGGQIEGAEMKSSIYIDQEEGFYNVNYLQVDDDTYHQMVMESNKLLKETGKCTFNEVFDRAFFSKNCYSVEEVIETLNSITNK